jgi:hypothetical protein
MKLVPTSNPPRKASARTFVTVSTTSGLDAVQIAIGMERRRTPFQVVPVMLKAGEKPAFDLRADPTDRTAAIDTMRSLLGSLMDASDRGMLEQFEITLGADLLRRNPAR